MHATIAAFSSGVPVIPVAYSRKFQGLFGSLGYDWVVDAKAASMDEAIAMIINGLDKRKEFSAQVMAGNHIAAEKLASYEAFLTDFLRGVYSA